MGTEEENQTAIKASTADATPATNNDNLTSVEGAPQKLPYPKSVFFIISNEFCERFNYYGMRTILVLYLTRKLYYDDDTATVIYHGFTFSVYLLCLLGAIISDSWLGKFRTILYLSIIYSIGSGVLAVSAIPNLDLPVRAAAFLGLALIALGSGGIKPCVAAFGGDQFKLPEQLVQMSRFFSVFYFSINLGSLFSTAITPILREDVHCFGELQCFSSAFGVPGILMMVSIVIFVLGKPLYKMYPPQGNMVVEVVRCVKTAISSRKVEKKSNPREHWLDYAEAKCGKQIVADTKVLLKILVLYIPLPLFWALFDQQGSRWTFQATRTDGDIGIYEVKPDQMQLVNPLLILVFIPVYEMVFYPFLAVLGIRRPLQKLTLGGIFAGFAFLLSAAVEVKLEATYPVLPQAGEAQLRIFNGFPCNYSGNLPVLNTVALGPYGYFEEKHIEIKKDADNKYAFTFNRVGGAVGNCPNVITGSYQLTSAQAHSVFLSASTQRTTDVYIDKPNKSPTGYPAIRVLFVDEPVKQYSFILENGDFEVHKSNSTDRAIFTVVPGGYRFVVDGKTIATYEFRQGSVSTIVVKEAGGELKHDQTLHIIAPPNSVNMMWLLPQYIVMTLGEVMFSVTGLSFSYSQAPESMKSVLQSFWMLTVAAGNVWVMIIAALRLFSSQVHEFLLFAILMFLNMGLFMILAHYYKGSEPVRIEEPIDDDDKKVDNKVEPTAPALPVTDNGHTNEGFKQE